MQSIFLRLKKNTRLLNLMCLLFVLLIRFDDKTIYYVLMIKQSTIFSSGILSRYGDLGRIQRNRIQEDLATRWGPPQSLGQQKITENRIRSFPLQTLIEINICFKSWFSAVTFCFHNEFWLKYLCFWLIKRYCNFIACNLKSWLLDNW